MIDNMKTETYVEQMRQVATFGWLEAGMDRYDAEQIADHLEHLHETLKECWECVNICEFDDPDKWRHLYDKVTRIAKS